MIGISAGNHAQALAWGAAAEGIDCLVVMYASASAAKVAATRGYGAAVDLEAADAVEAFARLDEHIRETGRTLVHPFDDPLVIAGQGTLGARAARGRARHRDDPRADGRRRPCRRRRRRGTRPARRRGRAGAVDRGARRARSRESVPVTPDSIADGLSGPFAGETALAVLQAHGVESMLVTERGDRGRISVPLQHAKLACEPAGAVAVAAVLAGRVGGRSGRHCCLRRQRSGPNCLCYPGRR